MNSVEKRVREMLGLGQRDMAHFFGISRVRLSHIEIDRKRLPDEARVVMADLLVLLESAAKIPIPSTQAEQMQALAQENIPDLEKELMRIRDAIRTFTAKRDLLLTRQFRLTWVMQHSTPGSDLHRLLSVALTDLESRLLPYSPENFLKLEKKRVSEEAWLMHLKGISPM